MMKLKMVQLLLAVSSVSWMPCAAGKTHCVVTNLGRAQQVAEEYTAGWIADCTRRIRRILQPKFQSLQGKKVTCFFKLSKSGPQAAEVRVVKPSGDSIVDREVVSAIRAAIPNFRPVESNLPYTSGVMAEFEGTALTLSIAK